ncbi:MAG: argininosuccinate synthase [bacterium]|nr:argininosuccinate synthase [bacterium]
MDKPKKVVLAYSGGLDTSVMIKWLVEKYDCEVIALTADVGQGEELEPLREKAIKTGASKIYIQDCREEFVKDFIFPALKTNAIYESKYLLATALGRPLITKHLVEIAKKENADAIAHGSTGKGNDQVRFEVSAMALAPELRVLAPVREWELKTREEEIEYAEKKGIPVEATKKNPYSYDLNLWGISIECGVLEDPWVEPPADIYKLTIAPEQAPNQPTYVEIEFEKGVPVALNGKRSNSVDLIVELNKIAGANGVGRTDLVENRLVGIKSREVYEAPAATVLHWAHRELEAITLDRETAHYKELVTQRYSELVYYGLWFSPLKKALDAFIDATQETVTGTIRMRLLQGTCAAVGRKSPYSLYKLDLATYEKGDLFDQSLAKGFVELWGLPIKIAAAVRGKK